MGTNSPHHEADTHLDIVHLARSNSAAIQPLHGSRAKPRPSPMASLHPPILRTWTPSLTRAHISGPSMSLLLGSQHLPQVFDHRRPCPSEPSLEVTTAYLQFLDAEPPSVTGGPKDRSRNPGLRNRNTTLMASSVPPLQHATTHWKYPRHAGWTGHMGW